MKEKAVGFTKAQRLWFLERDGYQCNMWWVENDLWVRCPNTEYLQVHHRIPRGWASLHMSKRFPINGKENGIVICRRHHVAYNANGDFHLAIHPDTELARMQYARGNKLAFQQMMEERKRLNHLGIPYWSTQHDWMFERLVERANSTFKKKYPMHKKFGVLGR